MVYFRRLAVVLEAHRQLLAGLDTVGPVVHVVVRVGWQLDYEHVGVVGTAVVAGFHRKTFPMVVVGRSDPGQADLREEFVVLGRAGGRLALGEVTVDVDEHQQG